MNLVILKLLYDLSIEINLDLDLDTGTNVNETANQLTLVGLAPGTQYTISVAGISTSGLTLPKVC